MESNQFTLVTDTAFLFVAETLIVDIQRAWPRS